MDFLKRLTRLQKILEEAGCDAILIEDQINLYYFTGLDLSAGKLLAHKKGAHLFVDSRYYEKCKKSSPFSVQQIDPPSLETIFLDGSFSFINRLAFDNQNTSYKDFQSLQKLTKALSKQMELIPLDSPLQRLRMIKDSEELTLLRHAGELGSQGFDFLCTILKEGITEQGAAIELEIFWKKKGGRTVAFDPIIAFGANSSMPHHRAGEEKLRPGQNVLIDIGVNYCHYHSDMTRVVFFKEPDPLLLKIHEIVQKAQQAALSLCRPGTLIGTLDSAARDFITESGYGPNFTHNLGHGVGLNIHEYPMIKNSVPFNSIPLSSGMVITIEPGIYIPELGGIRIEDTVIITENGFENLTNRKTDPLFIK